MSPGQPPAASLPSLPFLAVQLHFAGSGFPGDGRGRKDRFSQGLGPKSYSSRTHVLFPTSVPSWHPSTWQLHWEAGHLYMLVSRPQLLVSPSVGHTSNE